MDDCHAIIVDGLSKTYEHARVDGMQSSLREVFTSTLRAPWRLVPGFQSEEAKGDIVALRPVSFGVNRGEKLGIIGRNGSGKSTLLKILARITPPSAGRAEIRGRVASILEVGTGFHPELTGYENIFLNGAILGLRKQVIEDALEDIVAFAEIREFLDLPVKRYSSGMFVRLAFSVASHLACDVLLIDEVLAVGDEAFREKCIDRLQGEVDNGRTVVFISHDMTTVGGFCDRCIHLAAGSIDYDGNVDEAIERYRRRCRVTEEC